MPGCCVIGSLLLEPGLHRVEQLSIQNWRLFTREDFAFVLHLTNVEAIAQQIGQRTTREWDTADRPATSEDSDSCRDATSSQI